MIPLLAVIEDMSPNCTYDVCVIGAGVVGSSTAHYLASRGQNTLLLEQVSVIILSINSLALNWYHFEIRRIDFLGKYRGGGTPLQEANRDVPLDGVAFSRLE